MALPEITDVIRVSAEGKLGNGATWANVFHLRKAGGTSYATAIAAADPIVGKLWTNPYVAGSDIRQFLDDSFSFTLARYTPLDGITATTQLTHAVVGVAVDQALPAGVALCVSFHTAKRGRSYAGRMYLAGWGEGMNDDPGVPHAAYVTKIQQQFAAWITDLALAGLTLVVASYKHSTAEPVTTVTIDGVWDDQRRRQHP